MQIESKCYQNKYVEISILYDHFIKYSTYISYGLGHDNSKTCIHLLINWDILSPATI